MSNLTLEVVLSNISEHTNDAVLITKAEPVNEPGPVIVFVNAAFTRITGYSASEVIGKSPRILQGPDTSLKVKRQIGEALRAWRPIVTELLNYKKDGTPFWSELSLVPVADDAGIYRYWIGIQRDTTEVRKQQHELSIRSLAMDASTRSIAVCTFEGDFLKVIYGNRAFTNLLGDVETAGAAFLDLFATEGRRQEILAELRACVMQGRVFTSEETISPAVGGPIFARIMIEPIPSDVCASPRILIFIRDKTEEQALKEEVAQAQRLRAIGQMTGGIAHDFNNLLTILTHCSDILLAQTGLDNDSRSLIQTISATAERGAILTSQLLSFARRRPLETQHIDIRPFLDRFKGMIRRVIPSSIKIDLYMAPDLADPQADPTQLETALLNLAINARDAIRTHGSIRMVAENKTIDMGERRHSILPAGEYVSLSVIDDGPGMNEEVLEHAFEPFFTTKEVGQGTGLGLSMVYGFAQQSNGHVTITSTPGSGTAVEMLFPRSYGRSTAPSANPDLQPPVDLSAVGILVVEDNEIVLENVVKLIRSMGCRTYSAHNGSEALRLLQDHADVDLLFTDVVMAGGVSGVALAQEALVHRPDLKVLFTSGYSEEDPELIRALSTSAPLLKKPYHIPELAKALKQAALGGQSHAQKL